MAEIVARMRGDGPGMESKLRTYVDFMLKDLHGTYTTRERDLIESIERQFKRNRDLSSR